MKIVLLGLDYQPGKVNLKDARLDELKKLTGCPSKTYIRLDLIDSEKLSESDGIICTQENKLNLIIGDLDSIEKRLAQTEDRIQKDQLLKLKEELEKGNFLSNLKLTEDSKEILNYNFLTLKPIFLVIEGSADLDTILQLAFKEFGFISFFTTAGDKEARSWPIKQGTCAYDAAGKIHSDIQRGFIRAEVINYSDLVRVGSLQEAKNQNLMHVENKEYIVKDGDWINFRFNK